MATGSKPRNRRKVGPNPKGMDPQTWFHSKELRPLGIPYFRDRAKQALAALTLEPHWEALFEPNSYGFRPGRSAHDAIEAIHSSIPRKRTFVNASTGLITRRCFGNWGPIQRWRDKSGPYEGRRNRRKRGAISHRRHSSRRGDLALTFQPLHGMEEMLQDWIETIRALHPGGTILSKA